MRTAPLTFRKRVALELWRVRQQEIRRLHPLRQLFWECTLRCNLRCRHCGSDCRATAGLSDMPREDFLRVLDGIAAKTDPHQVFVVITGGEPLMRGDLEACGADIYERGFPWGIVTNALALTPRRLQGLLRAHIHAVTVSLDGLEEDHNWMRGHRQSFQRVEQAIQMLTRFPRLSFDVVTCVTRRNCGKLEQLKDYLIGKGVSHWRLFTVFPTGRAAGDPDMRLTGDEFRGVFEFLAKTRQEGLIQADYGCEGFLGNYEGDARDHLFTCQAGVTIGSVMADGAISACTSIRADYHQGNIYRDDFMEVWENRFQPYREREWMRTGRCAGCGYFRYCQGNGMHLRDENGQLLLCHMEKLRN